jgi:hypothetical protein
MDMLKGAQDEAQ